LEAALRTEALVAAVLLFRQAGDFLEFLVAQARKKVGTMLFLQPPSSHHHRYCRYPKKKDFNGTGETQLESFALANKPRRCEARVSFGGKLYNVGYFLPNPQQSKHRDPSGKNGPRLAD
jgi:hypothetical protein